MKCGATESWRQRIDVTLQGCFGTFVIDGPREIVAEDLETTRATDRAPPRCSAQLRVDITSRSQPYFIACGESPKLVTRRTKSALGDEGHRQMVGQSVRGRGIKVQFFVEQTLENIALTRERGTVHAASVLAATMVTATRLRRRVDPRHQSFAN
jgi:hypothetical protein